MRKIYILHGWAYSTEKWNPVLELLKKQGIETVILKIPGLTAPLKKVWDIDDYILWLHEILKKEPQKVVLMGHSNGGRISLAYAKKYPQKVKQLFLIDAAGIYHDDLPIRFKRFVFGQLAKAGKNVTQSKQLKVLLYKFAHEHDYEKAEPFVRETMRNLIKVDLRKDLSAIETPTTIIWGQNDKVTPLQDGKIFAAGLKNSSLHIISEARHSPMFTHPKEVTSIISKDL
ncbi:MAG: alpha/beta fold hydrolase [Candidatus Levyibacteriota bacterium]